MTPTRQEGTSGAHHHFQADITGFGKQHRTDTHGKISSPRLPFTQVGKCMGKAGLGMDFQEHFGQINPSSRAKTSSRNLSKLGGSSSVSRPVSVSVSRPFTGSLRTAALVGKFAAVR